MVELEALPYGGGRELLSWGILASPDSGGVQL